MPRGRRKNTLTIADLERMLEERKSSVLQLQKKRDDLMSKVEELDRQIAAAGGAAATSSSAGRAPAAKARRGRTAGGRVRNEASLGDSIATVMEGKGPMTVGDILTAVEASGYQSGSKNFRGIVNQTLIKDQRFQQASRGHYVMN